MLRRRGHDVAVIGNDYFEPLHRTYSFDFIPTGTLRNTTPDRPSRSLAPARAASACSRGEMMIPETRIIYDRILEQYEPGRTVVVAPDHRVRPAAARAPQRAAGDDGSFSRRACSEFEMPRLPGMPPVNSLPRWGKRFSTGRRYRGHRSGPGEAAQRVSQRDRPAAGAAVPRRAAPSTEAIVLYPDWFFPR